jgi:hypothetical protein
MRQPADVPPQNTRTILILLSVQSVVIILGSINRLTRLTDVPLEPFGYLRLLDFLNMLVLPLASLIAFWLLRKHLEASGGWAWQQRRAMLVLGALFLTGSYLLAASYGTHEVTNYLHSRFCLTDAVPPATVDSDICRIIAFNDDDFSHHVFFVGFVIVNTVMLACQVLLPRHGELTRSERAGIVINALFIAAGIVANLAFEDIGLDLVVIVILAALAVIVFFRRDGKNQPLILYYATAYTIGLAVTIFVRLISGRV